MKNPIRAIIFDCDGVLADTEELKFQAWQKALQSIGITFTADKYQLLTGQTSKSILSQVCKDNKRAIDPKLIIEKDQLYWSLQREGVKSIGYMEGVLKWARTMQNQLLLGVASSASKNEVMFNLNHLQIKDFFRVILSGKDDLSEYQNPGGVNKPQPYIYLEMSRRLGLKPEECIVLEDSAVGVEAAKKAGCLVIAVPNQWTMQQHFQTADFVITSPSAEQIIKCIEQLL